MEKEIAKSLALVKGAIANDVQVQIDAGKKAVLRFRPYVDAYRAANAEQRVGLLKAAEEIMAAVNDKVAAYRQSKHDPNYKAGGSAVRVSEFRRIMSFGAYDCAPAVLNGLKDSVLPFDGLLAAVVFTTTAPPRGKEKNGKPYPFNRPAPSNTQVQNAIKARAERKRGGEGNGNRATKRDARKAVNLGRNLVKGLLLWFNDHKQFKADAAKQVNTITVALAELQGIAKEAAKA